MKTYNLIISSKNQNSLDEFFNFLHKNLDLNFNYLKKLFNKKRKKKIITILKSPHVNKKAQEQFEIRLFSKQLKINTSQTFKFLIFLKKINVNLFPDIKISIKVFNDKQKNKVLNKKIFNPDNFRNKTNIIYYKNLELKNLKQIKMENYKKIQNTSSKNKNLLKMFELYGRY